MSPSEGNQSLTTAARSAFPVTSRYAYLNTGSMGPVSAAYAEALNRYTQHDVAGGRVSNRRYADLDSAKESLRDEFAALLQCDRKHLFLTQNTTTGLETIIESISWQSGDEVISTDLEHEACALPLKRQAELNGLKIRIAEISGPDDQILEAIANQMTDRTRLIAFTGTAFEAGRCLPIRRVAALARELAVPTLLDAAQSAGAIPLDLDSMGVDYCALPMQKWLCGPEGIGALYVRRESADLLTAAPRDRVIHGLGVLAASAEHLNWLRLTLGWDWIHRRTAELAAYARAAVEASGFATLMTPDSFAGLTTLTFEGAADPALAQAVEKHGFVVRHLAQQSAFRISTAFFNLEKEVDGLLSAFDALARKNR
ncbi:MAG: aminotransferase class V-fold PLP-dependent enzyme [Gammaproteobacteria bacterium]